MAADVTSRIRMINGDDSAKSTAPNTQDLLGGCCIVDTKELDLDLQVPCGWEKRLDLKSGRVYIQRCNFPNLNSNSEDLKSKFQDLTFPPTSGKPPMLTLFNDVSLDLKLVSPSSAAASPPSPPCNYQSVCTLDKVKSALERAEKETVLKKRSTTTSLTISSCSPRSTSSSSIKDTDSYPVEKPSATFAAGCPTCLLYVLISRDNPRCPRCNSNVPMPVADAKKPRIDLNMTI